jgi:hypothetical protein
VELSVVGATHTHTSTKKRREGALNVREAREEYEELKIRQTKSIGRESWENGF